MKTEFPLSEIASDSAQPPRLEKPVRITEQVWPEGTVPVVSVWCITYNHAKFIRDAIEGFLMQETTFPLQILIHDDASTDGTADIVREYQAKYPQLIQTVLQTENKLSQGHVVWRRARASLLEMVRGEFVAVCEGDDYWTHARKLEAQHEAMKQNPRMSMCFHNAVEQLCDTGEKRLFNREFSADIFRLGDMFKHNFVIPTASMLYRRTWLPTAEWRTQCICGDRAMQLLLADRGPFYFINEPWSVYRTHGAGMTRNVTKNYASTIIPNWLEMYYSFDQITKHRNEELVRQEIRRLVSERCRFQLYALRDELTAFRAGGATPRAMHSPDECRQAIDASLDDTASSLEEPDSSWFQKSGLRTATTGQALIAAGNAWYVRRQFAKALEFYRAAAGEGRMEARVYCSLLKAGFAGRVARSILHRLSLAWQNLCAAKSPMR